MIQRHDDVVHCIPPPLTACCPSRLKTLGSGVETIFRFLGSGVDFFLRNSLQGEGREWKKETQCGSGLGSWDTLVTYASRDTIQERWGERTHSRTQVQLSLNRSALAAARLQLLTLALGVGQTNCTLDISPAAASEEAAASRSCQYCCPARYSPVMLIVARGECHHERSVIP